MSLIQKFSNQLEAEAVTTRKMLAKIPDDKFNWQPHPKSMTIKRLATHIAELPGWIPMILNTDELDFSNTDYKTREVETTKEVLAYFEDCFTESLKALTNSSETQLKDPWTLRNGEKVISTEPKEEVTRMAISQIIHHRAQLGVYLRLLDVPIPGSYGPSADEMGLF